MRNLSWSKCVLPTLTILALGLLGHAPEDGWRVRTAHAQDNAADIAAANRKFEQMYAQGNYPAALAQAAGILKRAQSVLGEKHPNTLTSLNNYAYVLQARNRAAEALSYFERVLQLRAEVLGEKHPDTLVSLGNYASALVTLGRLAEALPHSERALKLSTDLLGEKHPDTVIALNNHADLLRDLGRVAEALPHIERALRLGIETMGEKHPDTLGFLNNYAFALQELGRAAEALPHFVRALKLSTEALGEKHRITQYAINSYANVLQTLGRTVEALPYYERALKLRTEILGEKHPETLLSLGSYATGLQVLGRPADALPYSERALKFFIEILGEKHPNTLLSLNNYARVLQELGRVAEALPHDERVLKLSSEMLGEKHPSTLLSLNNYAGTLEALGRTAEALPYYARFIAGAEAQRDEAGRDSTESQRGVLGNYLYGYHDYLRALKDTGGVREALSVLERTKARTLLEQMTLRSAATSSGLPDTEAKKLLEYSDRIGALDTRIAQTGKDAEREALKAERNTTSRALAELKRELQGRYPRFHQITEVRLATAEDARNLLPANGVFVSYIVMRGNTVKALTLNAAGEVTWFDIAALPGLADTVEALRMWTANLSGSVLVDDTGRTIQILRWVEGSTPRWRVVAAGQACSTQQMQQDKQQNESTAAPRGLNAPVTGNAGADCIPPGAAFVSREAQYQELIAYLGKSLLDPLQSQLAGKQQVIISPDGPLGLVPWDVLPLNGKPLIAQFEVSQVQSLSVLKLLRERQAEYGRNKTRDALLAIGNPEYGSNSGAANRGKGVTMTRSPFTRQGSGNPAEMLRNLKWVNLPGTQVEMDLAAKIFAGQSRVVSGKAASETTLRRLSTGGELAQYRYLLFAAHGYFDPNFPAYSSLVLAPEGTEPERDGYVTMGEWVGMNLKSELTLLSACNTARGENISGEGLMGLAYALYVAGNTNTVLTLWPVADEETAEFVGSLLTKIKAGQPHAQAITATKREFLNHDHPRKRNPYFWAPFVLYGM